MSAKMWAQVIALCSVSAICIICCSSCGSDNSIYGYWESLIPVNIYRSDTSETEKAEARYYYVFERNNSGYTGILLPGVTEQNWNKAQSQQFEYEVSNGQIILMFNNDNKRYYEYDLKGNNMTLSDVNYGTEYFLQRNVER